MREPEKLWEDRRLLYIMGQKEELIDLVHPEPAAFRAGGLTPEMLRRCPAAPKKSAVKPAHSKTAKTGPEKK